MYGRAITLGLGLLLAGWLATASALAGSPPSPWDGVNPFHCTIQNAGLGTKVPDPAADPYCVHFDKTHQNLTQLGVVNFLTKEPARVAAASPKCFYFQEDHWRGSLVQSDGHTVIYEFHGHYFFDKATGDGGAWISGFKAGGQTYDPTTLPGFPPADGRFFGPGTGGVITHNDVPADPRCAAIARRNPRAIYATSANQHRCVPGVGRVDRRGVGPVALGMRDDRLRAELGPPRSVKRGFLHYCVSAGGSLLVGEPGDRSGTFGPGGPARAVIVLTSSRVFWLRGQHGVTLRVGSTRLAVRRGFPRAQEIAHMRHRRIIRAGAVIVVLAHGRVAYLGAYQRRVIVSKRSLKGYLRRAG